MTNLTKPTEAANELNRRINARGEGQLLADTTGSIPVAGASSQPDAEVRLSMFQRIKRAGLTPNVA
jgi:hypothetical protein